MTITRRYYGRPFAPEAPVKPELPKNLEHTPVKGFVVREVNINEDPITLKKLHETIKGLGIELDDPSIELESMDYYTILRYSSPMTDLEYESTCQNYNKDIEKYNTAMKQHQIDIVKYNELFAKWKEDEINWLTKRLADIQTENA